MQNMAQILKSNVNDQDLKKSQIINNSDWYLDRCFVSEVLSALKIQKGVQRGETKWCLEWG